MKQRWILIFLLIWIAGVIGILVTSCAYKGNVTLTTRDSFRFISPDVELYPKLHTETTIDNDDDDNPKKEEEK
jgi:hypothetical protein